MDNSKKIQLGLLGVVAVLLVLNLTGAFDGLFGGSDSDVKEAARQSITSVSGDVSPNDKAAANATKAAEPAVPAGPSTSVDWTEKEFDYGVVEQGEKVTHLYKFKNTGDEPLIISNAKGSCGCTVPQWPKDPVMPGESGEIKVQFDSKGKKGKQSKRVTITANTDPPQTFLTIKGEINAPEGDAAGIKTQPIKPSAPAQ
ncbi:MAG: DUF1573 domain-containing protein [Saprospiraceae bacterium]|nr:DUF1573 domain-containing protein [Saprospiraceae bacterium]